MCGPAPALALRLPAIKADHASPALPSPGGRIAVDRCCGAATGVSPHAVADGAGVVVTNGPELRGLGPQPGSASPTHPLQFPRRAGQGLPCSAWPRGEAATRQSSLALVAPMCPRELLRNGNRDTIPQQHAREGDGQKAIAEKLRKTAANCRKLRDIAKNCKKLRGIAGNCGKLWKIAGHCEKIAEN